ncbi:cytochrome b5-like heme/steroid binding domain-containing protein [Penicillium canescens]|nr:cytochrome b5-like heme/steroid binding domain-containing protein [Penicillium canescens]
MAAVRSFTKEEISKHNSPHSLYMVIHGKVYDCTKFVNKHPGGEEVILEVAGQDATEPYDEVGHSEDADRILRNYYIGELQEQVSILNPIATPTFLSCQHGTRC